MFEMTERSFAISNVSTDVSLTESFNPQLQAETASPPVLEGHEEAREAGVLGKLPTPQADTTIDRRPPAPLPRDRSQPISGYEAVVRTNAATASDYIYATTRDRTPASTHLTVAQREFSYTIPASNTPLASELYTVL